MSGALPLKQLQYDLGRRICQVVGYHGLGAGAGFGRQVIITIPCMHDVSPTAESLPLPVGWWEDDYSQPAPRADGLPNLPPKAPQHRHQSATSIRIVYLCGTHRIPCATRSPRHMRLPPEHVQIRLLIWSRPLSICDLRSLPVFFCSK